MQFLRAVWEQFSYGFRMENLAIEIRIEASCSLRIGACCWSMNLDFLLAIWGLSVICNAPSRCFWWDSLSVHPLSVTLTALSVSNYSASRPQPSSISFARKRHRKKHRNRADRCHKDRKKKIRNCLTDVGLTLVRSRRKQCVCECVQRSSELRLRHDGGVFLLHRPPPPPWPPSALPTLFHVEFNTTFLIAASSLKFNTRALFSPLENRSLHCINVNIKKH